MQKGIVSCFTAMGMAAAIIAPLAYGAQGQENRGERRALTVNESIDRADARIANLKADLRLSSGQAGHWSGLESALHDIAAKRAKSWAASAGGASPNSVVEGDRSITEDEKERDAHPQRDARKAPPDDIDGMRQEADALTLQAADLRQIADAAKPLYDTLDDRQRRRLVQFIHEDLRANETDDRRDRRR
jgi:hypothetical protein